MAGLPRPVSALKDVVRKTFRTGIALVVLALVLHIVGLVLDRVQERALAAPQRPAQDVPATAEAAAAAPAAALPALPATDVPLPAQIEPLRVRADAGDRKAACRLALQLLRCRDVATLASMVAAPANAPRLEAEMAGADDTRLKAMDDFFARQQQGSRDCAALAPDLHARAGALLRQAALAGEPDAMLQYARGASLQRPDEGFGFLRDPAFETWRQEAPRMLEAAVAAGNADAVLILATAYWPDASGSGGLARLAIREDVFLGAVYFALYSRLHGMGTQPPRHPALSDAERERAMRMAEDWHRNRFGGRRLARRDSFDTGWLYDFSGMTPGLDEVVACDSRTEWQP
jgi:hypothetical protein